MKFCDFYWVWLVDTVWLGGFGIVTSVFLKFLLQPCIFSMRVPYVVASITLVEGDVMFCPASVLLPGAL